MIEQMKIGVSLLLQGDATPKIIQFQKEVSKAASSVDRLQKNLKSTDIILSTIATRLEKLNPLIEKFALEVGKSSFAMKELNIGIRNASRGTTGLGSSISSTSVKMASAARSAQLYKNELLGIAGASRSANVHRIGGGRGGNGGGSHGNAAFGRHVGQEFGSESGKIGFIAGLASGGNIGLGAAIGGAVLLSESYKAQSRFQQAQAQFAGQGFGAANNQLASQTALRSRVRGVSTTDMLQAISDAATVTRNVPGAISIAPDVAKMEFANKITYGMKGRQFTNQDEMRMLQFAELRSGSTDPKKFLGTLNLLEQGYASDAARLSTNDIRTFGRQGASFLKNLSDRGFIEMLPLMQSLGGQRTATGATTMQTSLFKGQNMRTGKRAVAEFGRLGIYKNGRLAPNLAGSLTSSPVDFIYNTLLPAMAKKGITTPAQISSELGVLFTQSVTRLIQQAISQKSRIMAQVGLVPQANNIQSNYVQALNLNPGHVQAFLAAWDSMMTNMGKFSSPAVNAGMDALTKFFLHMSSFFSNPGAALARRINSNLPGALDTSATPGGSALTSIYNRGSSLVHHLLGGSAANSAGSANSSTSGVVGQTNSRPVIITMNSRAVAEGIIPDVVSGLTRLQFATSNGFIPYRTPTPPNTSSAGY